MPTCTARPTPQVEGDLLAPMPGMVVRVHVTEGEQVEKGQLLVVLELMKMQMEMRAACAGKVSQVNAQPRMYGGKGGCAGEDRG